RRQVRPKTKSRGPQKNVPLDPLGDVAIPPAIVALPKADLHLHQQWSPRLDRVFARREGRPAYDWREWARRVMAQTPPGSARLRRLGGIEPTPPGRYERAKHFLALGGGWPAGAAAAAAA